MSTVSLVASFTIEYTRYLDPQGAPAATLPDFALDPAALIRLYRAMVLTRAFDRKAIALQRTGRLGTYASSLGQEAVAVGVADPMQRDDVFLPSFRELGGQIVRGVGLTELFLNWGGDERGSDFAAAREDFPISVPIGSRRRVDDGIWHLHELPQEPEPVHVIVTVRSNDADPASRFQFPTQGIKDPEFIFRVIEGIRRIDKIEEVIPKD